MSDFKSVYEKKNGIKNSIEVSVPIFASEQGNYCDNKITTKHLKAHKMKLL